MCVWGNSEWVCVFVFVCFISIWPRCDFRYYIYSLSYTLIFKKIFCFFWKCIWKCNNNNNNNCCCCFTYEYLKSTWKVNKRMSKIVATNMVTKKVKQFEQNFESYICLWTFWLWLRFIKLQHFQTHKRVFLTCPKIK